MSIEGPMARTVPDVAMMFDCQTGHHPLDPISLPAPEIPFSATLESAPPPVRIGYSPDLGGIAPVAQAVRNILAAAISSLQRSGFDVVEAAHLVRVGRREMPEPQAAPVQANPPP